ncbi:DUF6339 family protein [Streptomyces sp. NPDC059909]|uniref:DUF6339 family protein n=1 Tax=Streptomyces sp. NPDC059909 TaxID=3346998 RepID=UPI00365113FB
MSWETVYEGASAAPERLALLPDAIARRELDDEVLRGRTALPLQKLDQTSRAALDGSDRWLVRPVRELFDAAMRRFVEEYPGNSDAWLAPRLHAALRLTRREAGNPELWNFLALRVAPDYVLWRWLGGATDGDDAAVSKTEPKVNLRRFIGPFHVQAMARLWWAAEVYRNGRSYATAVAACSNQEMFNSALRQDVFLHRPTAQAVIRMLRDGTVDSTRAANALIKAVNAAGSTIQYEVVAPDEPMDAKARRLWIEDLAFAPPVPHDSLPEGPDDGEVDFSSIARLLPIFEDLFRAAPVRGKRQGPEGENPYA